MQGKFSEAIAPYSKALQIKPDSAEMHYNSGTVLTSQGKINEATDSFWQSLRLNSDYEIAQGNLNLALILQKKSK